MHNVIEFLDDETFVLKLRPRFTELNVMAGDGGALDMVFVVKESKNLNDNQKAFLNRLRRAVHDQGFFIAGNTLGVVVDDDVVYASEIKHKNKSDVDSMEYDLLFKVTHELNTDELEIPANAGAKSAEDLARVYKFLTSVEGCCWFIPATTYVRYFKEDS